MGRRFDVVFLDVGGPIYDDAAYYSAVLSALREMGAAVSDEEYALEYDRLRHAQDGSFRRGLTRRFLGPGGDADEVARRAARYWEYPPEALLPDVRPCLAALSSRYRLGVIANQQASIRETMRRDGIDAYFEAWAISEELGVEKPDVRIFRHGLAEAAVVDSRRAAMVGDRLDYDVRPAKGLGMRTLWVLRGEAPTHPTPEQLSEPDASVRSLADLPEALERLELTPSGSPQPRR